MKAKSSEIASITTSFAVMSLLGVLFVFSYWAERNDYLSAFVRSVLFVGIVGMVHYVGSWLYRRQFSGRDAQSISNRTPPQRVSDFRRWNAALSPQYATAIRAAVPQQLIVLMLSALVLDGGHMFRVAVAAFAAHWFIIAISLIRRSKTPTDVDLAIIKFGYVPLVFLIYGIMPASWDTLLRAIRR